MKKPVPTALYSVPAVDGFAGGWVFSESFQLEKAGRMAEIQPQAFELNERSMPETECNEHDGQTSVQRASPTVLPEPARSRSGFRLFAVLAGLFVSILGPSPYSALSSHGTDSITALLVHCSP